MAFNSDNDPDLLIDPDFWGKGFRSRRNDPAIHRGGERVIWSVRSDDDYFKDDEIHKHNLKHADDEDESVEVDPWVEKCWKVYGKYVRVSKLAAGIARDAIFKGVGLEDVYRMISKRFLFEADALAASVKAKRKKNRK